MSRDPQFNNAVFDNVTRALAHAVDHMTMVGRSSAEERLAWFLWMLGGRGRARRSARSNSPCSVRTSPTISA